MLDVSPQKYEKQTLGYTTFSAVESTQEVALYHKHIAEKLSGFQKILNDSGYDELLIASGDYKMHFQDDLFYPFKANPYFREWTPLNKRTGSYIHFTKNSVKPRLYSYSVPKIFGIRRARACLRVLMRLSILLNILSLIILGVLSLTKNCHLVPLL